MDSRKGQYTATVRYKLEWNSCVSEYTRIYVSSVTITHKILFSQAANSKHYSDWRQIVNCSGLTKGCNVYPGTTYYFDGTDLVRFGNTTITFTYYPGVYMPYIVTAATYELWYYDTQLDGLTTYDHFSYQFLRNYLEVAPR